MRVRGFFQIAHEQTLMLGGIRPTNSVCSISCRVTLGGDQPLQGWWCGSGLKAYIHTTFLGLHLFQTEHFNYLFVSLPTVHTAQFG